MSTTTRLRVISLVVGAGLTVAACSSSGTTSTTAPKPPTLRQAVANTLAAANYSEVLSESTPQGQQTDYLTYQAPNRLGGYIQTGSTRTYVYVIGNTVYQSQAVPIGAPATQLTFHRQSGQGAKALDPAHGYLPYVTQAAHPTRSGNSYSFTLTQQGRTGTFTYTVHGQYISTFTLTVPGSSVRTDISDVGSSPPVRLPKGSHIAPGGPPPTTTAPPA